MEKYQGQISYKVIIITIKNKEQKKKICKHNNSMLERHSHKTDQNYNLSFQKRLEDIKKEYKTQRTSQSGLKNS